MSIHGYMNIIRIQTERQQNKHSKETAIIFFCHITRKRRKLEYMVKTANIFTKSDREIY